MLAVDPGGTCGMAYATFLDSKAYQFNSMEKEPFDAVAFFEEHVHHIRHLVYETFTPRPGVRTWQPDALYTIGALRYIAAKSQRPATGQSPADAKKFSTNEKLEKIGWRRPSAGGHQDDAARHLLLAAVRLNLIDPATLI